MSEYQIIRDGDPVRSDILTAKRQIATAEWAAACDLWGLRGEQPETSALPEPGALRGDVPLSNPDKEIK